MRRLGVAGLVFCALAAVAIPSAASPPAQPAPAPPAADRSGRTGNLIAMVRSPRIVAPAGEAMREALLDAARGRIEAVLDRSGLPRVRSIPELGAVAVRPAPGQGLARARRELEADPAVRRVELERYRTLRYLPDDPALTRRDARAPSNDFYQWNLRQERFRKAWKRTRGRRAKLAVIDTGIDGGHFDLAAADRLFEGLRLRRLRWRPRSRPARGRGTTRSGTARTSPGWPAGRATTATGSAGAAFKCKLIDREGLRHRQPRRLADREVDHRRHQPRRRRDQHELRRPRPLGRHQRRPRLRIQARRRPGRGRVQQRHHPPGNARLAPATERHRRQAPLGQGVGGHGGGAQRSPRLVPARPRHRDLAGRLRLRLRGLRDPLGLRDLLHLPRQPNHDRDG